VALIRHDTLLKRCNEHSISIKSDDFFTDLAAIHFQNLTPWLLEWTKLAPNRAQFYDLKCNSVKTNLHRKYEDVSLQGMLNALHAMKVGQVDGASVQSRLPPDYVPRCRNAIL
jgi:hypothetical protein